MVYHSTTDELATNMSLTVDIQLFIALAHFFIGAEERAREQKKIMMGMEPLFSCLMIEHN